MRTNGIRIGHRETGTGHRGKARAGRATMVGPVLRTGHLRETVARVARAGSESRRYQRRPYQRLAARRGQTASEYLMIAGIMTAIGLLVLLWFFQPWRNTVQDVTDCVRTDDCEPVGAQ